MDSDTIFWSALMGALILMIFIVHFSNTRAQKSIIKSSREKTERFITDIKQAHQSPPIVELPWCLKIVWMTSGCEGIRFVTRLMRPEEEPQEYTAHRYIPDEAATHSVFSSISAVTGHFPRLLIVKERKNLDIVIRHQDDSVPIVPLPLGHKLTWLRIGCDTDLLTRARQTQEPRESYLVYKWSDPESGVILEQVIQET